MSLATVREALVARLSSLDLNVVDHEPVDPKPPTLAVMMPDRIDTRPQFGSLGWIYAIPLRLFVGGGDDATASATLDRYLDETGADSIVAALLEDATLGGRVDSCDVTDVTDFAIFDAGAPARLYACSINVEVRA